MKINLTKILNVSTFFVATGAFAQQGSIYPFKYSQTLNVSYEQGSSEVYPGVIAAIDNADLKVMPTRTLFVAPKRAKVAVKSFAANEFAGCQEVKNDLVVSDELSEVFLDLIQTYKQDSAWILEIQTEETRAKRECKNAIVSGSSLKDQLCETARELSELRLGSIHDVAPVLEKINEIRDIASTRLDTYGNQYGGFASAIVELWDKSEIDEVKKLNPNMNVLVVPIENVMFDFVAGLEKNSALGESIPRRNALGFALQGETMRTNSSGGSPEAVTHVKTGQSTSLGISLSRLGACSKQDLVRKGTFTYQYDTFGHIRGEASYNKYDFYKRIKTKSTRNGFFSTKTTQQIIHEYEGSDTFKIAAMGDNFVSQAEMRERLLQAIEKKIIGEIAIQVAGDTNLEAPNPGAETAGDALLKCPNFSCQVGGYVLKTAADIWGEGTTEDAFAQRWNREIKEVWSETTMHKENGSSSADIRFN